MAQQYAKRFAFLYLNDVSNVVKMLNINKCFRYCGYFNIVRTLSIADDDTYIPVQAGKFEKPTMVNTLNMIREIENIMKQEDPNEIWLFLLGSFDRALTNAISTLLSRTSASKSILYIVTHIMPICPRVLKRDITQSITQSDDDHDKAKMLHQYRCINIVTSCDCLHEVAHCSSSSTPPCIASFLNDPHTNTRFLTI